MDRIGQGMKRLLLMACLASAFAYAWQQLDEIPLLVVGQPTTTGTIQKAREAPFFDTLGKTTQIPFRITYKPLDHIGLKDNYQLQMLKNGTIDLASLRFTQNSADEPSLQGIDLIDMISDYDDAEQVIAAYTSTVDHYLQTKFNTKLLGVWTFGPQEIFCKRPIKQLNDIKGLKVRVPSPAVSSYISELGATPAVISFDETKNALGLGLVDCAITSAASANFAGWPKYARYNYPIATQFGLNGYAISLRKWNALSRQQQSKLQGTFDTYLRTLWQFSKELHIDAAKCNTGGHCKYGTPYQGASASVSAKDIQLSRQIMIRTVLPEWGKRCEKVHPGCLAIWQQKLATYLDDWKGKGTLQQL